MIRSSTLRPYFRKQHFLLLDEGDEATEPSLGQGPRGSSKGGCKGGPEGGLKGGLALLGAPSRPIRSITSRPGRERRMTSGDEEPGSEGKATADLRRKTPERVARRPPSPAPPRLSPPLSSRSCSPSQRPAWLQLTARPGGAFDHTGSQLTSTALSATGTTATPPPLHRHATTTTNTTTARNNNHAESHAVQLL